MWTTSSSRARAVYGLALAACLGGCASTPGRTLAPEAPAAAPAARAVRPAPGLPRLDQPVELRAVTVTRPRDQARELFAGALARQQDPLVIEVQTARPLDLTPRTSFPVIVLNGEVLKSSRISPRAADRLLAVVPGRALIRERNRVEVMWIGSEEATRTRRPLVFTAGDVAGERTRTHDGGPEGGEAPPPG